VATEKSKTQKNVMTETRKIMTAGQIYVLKKVAGMAFCSTLKTVTTEIGIVMTDVVRVVKKSTVVMVYRNYRNNATTGILPTAMAVPTSAF